MNIARTFILFAVFGSLTLTGSTRQLAADEPGGLCCLCMCHSANENKCAPLCVKMQHGKKIIEEPQMKSCTKSCLRHRVRQVFLAEESK
jgi:hypothetical protein